jgi:hypothetical protein
MCLRKTAFPWLEELVPRTILPIDGNTRISAAIEYPTQPT